MKTRIISRIKILHKLHSVILKEKSNVDDTDICIKNRLLKKSILYLDSQRVEESPRRNKETWIVGISFGLVDEPDAI